MKASIETLARELGRHGVELVTMEATGPYHRLACAMLHEAKIAVVVVNPFRSRQFADSLGRVAKSDTIDAESLALFAERMKPTPTAPPDAHQGNRGSCLCRAAQPGQRRQKRKPHDPGRPQAVRNAP